MKAVVIDRFGDPEEVLQIRDVPLPEPKQGEVRIRMLASPVNPSDVLTIRGQYGKQPPLPMTPGFEGVGVAETGSGLLARRVLGKRVAVLNGINGKSREYVTIPAKMAVPIPDDLPDEQVASFFVNPASALIMCRYVLKVPAKAWLLQTAAGSALGKMVIRLGKRFGFKTINVVRRGEQAEELRRAGAETVIATDRESIVDRVREITKGAGVGFAIDAVGGETGTAIVQCLGHRGRALFYGRLSGEPVSVDPSALIVGQKRIDGFWLSEWVRAHNPVTMYLLFRRLSHLIRDGVLRTDTGTSFPLDQVKDAVRQATAPGNKGKVLLRIASR